VDQGWKRRNCSALRKLPGLPIPLEVGAEMVAGLLREGIHRVPDYGR